MNATIRQQITESNPALKELIALVGEWDMELSNADFLPSPSDTAKGQVSFNWLEDGAFLVMRMGQKVESAPQAVWLIGRDETSGEYRALYYDTRKVSRIYEMSLSDGVWKLWRNSPGFSQRFAATFSEDRKTIKGHWEKSTDGSHWAHDFDVKYTKIVRG